MAKIIISTNLSFKSIPLTRRKFAIVDEADYDWLKQWKWYCSKTGYAVRGVWENGKRFTKRMHRIIVNTPNAMETDHINGNRLDNRRCNLRICTTAQNQMNRGVQKNNQSGYKGVSYIGNNKWKAIIKLEGRDYFIGRFSSKIEAAKAYNEAALKYYGEYAGLNPIEEGTRL